MVAVPRCRSLVLRRSEGYLGSINADIVVLSGSEDTYLELLKGACCCGCCYIYMRTHVVVLSGTADTYIELLREPAAAAAIETASTSSTSSGSEDTYIELLKRLVYCGHICRAKDELKTSCYSQSTTDAIYVSSYCYV